MRKEIYEEMKLDEEIKKKIYEEMKQSEEVKQMKK